MANIALVERVRLADQYFAYVLDAPQGAVIQTIELTAEQYAALALPNAGPPPGVSVADWESGRAFAVGGVRNYGAGKRFLDLGEFEELADRFEFGLPVAVAIARFVSRTLAMYKSKILFSRTGGLTITKVEADAWPDRLRLTAISAGVLTIED
jgi:hypothetical protein